MMFVCHNQHQYVHGLLTRYFVILTLHESGVVKFHLQYGGRRPSAMAVAVVIRVILTLFNTISPCFDRNFFPGGKFFRNSCSVASSTGTILSEALSYRCWMSNVAPSSFNGIMFLTVTDSLHGFVSFVLASGCVRKAHTGGCILPQ